MRPTFTGLEMHLATILKIIKDFEPSAVIVDPLNSFTTTENSSDAKSLAMRLVDYLKLQHITAFFTSLTSAGSTLEHTDVFISSLIDTWLLLRDIELGGERNRGIYVLKSRGMAHSNQIREFQLTNNGIVLRDVYVGLEGVLTGSARVAQEAKDNSEQLMHKELIEQKKLTLDRKRKNLKAQIAALQAEFESEEAESLKLITIEENRIKNSLKDLSEIALSRKSNGGKILKKS
jgi:circadian clock protein KaiC